MTLFLTEIINSLSGALNDSSQNCSSYNKREEVGGVSLLLLSASAEEALKSRKQKSNSVDGLEWLSVSCFGSDALLSVDWRTTAAKSNSAER